MTCPNTTSSIHGLRVVVLVSCLPVVTLGFGAALTHLLRDTAADDAPEAVTMPALDDTVRAVAQAAPEVESDAVPTPAQLATTARPNRS